MEFSTTYENDLFLRAAMRLSVPRTPVWIMRQAGRYLPEYREIRAKVDFQTLYRTPDLLAEVTVQPVDIIGVDAAILFSDILVIPEAMGMQLEFSAGEGPVFHYPVRSGDDIRLLRVIDPVKDLHYVLEGIRVTSNALSKRVPLIGFAGSPWTLATYMVEGGKTRDFAHIKTMMYNEPGLLHQLLGKLSLSISQYLSAQIDAGAAAVQIFDTWGGVLAPDEYIAFSLDYIQQIVENVKSNGTPIIFYSKGSVTQIGAIADTGADVLGIDWTMDIGAVRNAFNDRIAIQGNLDPTVLFAKPEIIRQEAKKILQKYGKGSGHIFNLGHGILPTTPVENVQALIAAIKKESPAYHDEKEVNI